MPAQLSVNLNAVAYLRNRRSVPWPNLLDIARAVLSAGAHGITVHPRPDERHIRASDVGPLADLIANEFPGRELNIEGFPTRAFLDLALSARAQQVTLVPDSPEQATSDHGWDFAANAALLSAAVREIQSAGARAALFVDAIEGDADAARQTGADRIELYTGPYAEAGGAADHLGQLARTADAARGPGGAMRPLGINAGHDLTCENLPPLCAAIPDLAEVSIGHGLTADALLIGFPEAVRRYLAALGHT